MEAGALYGYARLERFDNIGYPANTICLITSSVGGLGDVVTAGGFDGLLEGPASDRHAVWVYRIGNLPQRRQNKEGGKQRGLHDDLLDGDIRVLSIVREKLKRCELQIKAGGWGLCML